MRRCLVLALLVPLLAAAEPTTTALGPDRQAAGAEPVFRTEAVTAARLGSSHRPGCPVPVADLRLVTAVGTAHTA